MKECSFHLGKNEADMLYRALSALREKTSEHLEARQYQMCAADHASVCLSVYLSQVRGLISVFDVRLVYEDVGGQSFTGVLKWGSLSVTFARVHERKEYIQIKYIWLV